MTKFKTMVLNIAIAVSLIAAGSFVVQLHLWQARAQSLAGTPVGGMSSFIQDLHSRTKNLPVQVIEDLN